MLGPVVMAGMSSQIVVPLETLRSEIAQKACEGCESIVVLVLEWETHLRVATTVGEKGVGVVGIHQDDLKKRKQPVSDKQECIPEERKKGDYHVVVYTGSGGQQRQFLRTMQARTWSYRTHQSTGHLV